MAVQAFDRSVLKVGQVFIIGLNVIAFALGFVLQLKLAWLLVPVVGAIMLAGVVNPNLNLFRQFYLRVLKPAGIVKPNVAQEDAAPHQFAQGWAARSSRRRRCPSCSAPRVWAGPSPGW